MLVQEVANFLGCNSQFLISCAQVFGIVTGALFFSAITSDEDFSKAKNSDKHYSFNPRIRTIQKSAEFWFGE